MSLPAMFYNVWICFFFVLFFFFIRTLFMLCCYLPGQTERKRILRRTVARYMMFGIILIARSISVAVMKRFPTLDHIVEAGNKTLMYDIMINKGICSIVE